MIKTKTINYIPMKVRMPQIRRDKSKLTFDKKVRFRLNTFIKLKSRNISKIDPNKDAEIKVPVNSKNLEGNYNTQSTNRVTQLV